MKPLLSCLDYPAWPPWCCGWTVYFYHVRAPLMSLQTLSVICLHPQGRQTLDGLWMCTAATCHKISASSKARCWDFNSSLATNWTTKMQADYVHEFAAITATFEQAESTALLSMASLWKAQWYLGLFKRIVWPLHPWYLKCCIQLKELLFFLLCLSDPQQRGIISHYSEPSRTALRHTVKQTFCITGWLNVQSLID